MEATCGRCHGPNLLSWYAPSPLWNHVMRQVPGEPEPFDGIVCPRCFAELAAERGVEATWRLSANPEPPGLVHELPDGRTWDTRQDLWVD